MTVRINKQKINLREKLTEFEDKVNFDEVVRGLGENTAPLILNKDGGNVGIGTTNPAVKLDIQGNSNITSRLTLTRTDAGRTAVLSANADSPACPFVGSASNSNFAIYTNNSAKMLIDTNGNVGIGTTNPGGSLHVNTVSKALSGTVSVTAGTAAVTGTNTSFDTELRVGDRIKIKSQILTVQGITDDTTLTLSANHIAGASGETAYTDNNGLIVASDGKVGIGAGIPNPQVPLEVNGGVDNSVVFRGRCDSDPSHTGSGAGNNGRFNLVAFSSDAGNDYGGGIKIQTRDGVNVFHDRMTIDEAGNVGIGTTDPGAYKLYINGTARVSGGDVTSDDRVKHNEQNIVGAIETLSKITPKKYIKTTEMYEADHDFELDADGNPVDANGEPVEHSIEAGVIAQQVLGVPELAFMVGPEGVDEDGNVNSPHGLNYNSLFTYAIAAIQEQQSIIEDLKSRIETLESK